jgi:glycosyltransferase involved in cell wall biosynthesis
MKRIVIDAREYPSSTGRYIRNLIAYLEKTDQQHQYVVLLRPDDLKLYQPKNPNFTVAASRYKEFSFGEQIGFAWQLYRLKADLVHFGMTQQPLLYWKRSITTIHDITMVRFTDPTKNKLKFGFRQFVYKLVIWFAAHKSKRVIVPSEFVKNDLVKFARVNPKKVVVTYESANEITKTAQPVDGLNKYSYILYVGRPGAHKNLDRLVEAFAKLKTTQPNLHLVLAGRNDERYELLASKVQQLGVKDVYFTGFISEGQLRWLYEHASAYVFPSLSEGFGLPGLEAMQYGVPVVSSNATCLPEIYKDAAMYFDPLDVNDMAAKIESVLANKDQTVDDLINKGTALLKTYSWQKMAHQTLVEYAATLPDPKN